MCRKPENPPWDSILEGMTGGAVSTIPISRVPFPWLRYTGGTIGMMKGPDGSLRPEPGALKGRLQKIEELNQEQFGSHLNSSTLDLSFWLDILIACHEPQHSNAVHRYDILHLFHSSSLKVLAATHLGVSFGWLVPWCFFSIC